MDISSITPIALREVDSIGNHQEMIQQQVQIKMMSNNLEQQKEETQTLMNMLEGKGNSIDEQV